MVLDTTIRYALFYTGYKSGSDFKVTALSFLHIPYYIFSIFSYYYINLFFVFHRCFHDTFTFTTGCNHVGSDQSAAIERRRRLGLSTIGTFDFPVSKLDSLVGNDREKNASSVCTSSSILVTTLPICD